MGNKITADTKFSILGTFEGECLDTQITNLNGLDITLEVMENVIASEEYKQGIGPWLSGVYERLHRTQRYVD